MISSSSLRLTVSLAVILFASLPALALADLIVLNPLKDNTLIQGTNAAAQLSNGQGDIFVGRTNQDGQNAPTISIRRGLIAFDLSSIPVGAVINSVQMSMTDVQGLNGNQTVNLFRTLEDWGEGSSFFNGGQGAAAANGDATWLYRSYDATNPALSIQWTTPGGSFSANSSASALISAGPSGQVFNWNNAQMVADVQFWLQNPQSNFGWTLIGNESAGQTAKRLASGESATPPTLSITFTAVPEPSSMVLLSLAGIGFSVCKCKRRRSELAK